MDSVTKIETDHIKRVNKLFYLVGGLFVGLPILAGAMLYGDEEGIPVIVIAGFLAVPLGLFAYLAIDLASFDRRRIRLVLGLIGAICFFFVCIFYGLDSISDAMVFVDFGKPLVS